jgi:malonate decarboxylase delta subunit
METLKFRFENGQKKVAGAPRLIGVVSSGNLEILIESASLNNGCEIEVRTPIQGFSTLWERVLSDFHSHWKFADTRLTINDMGATPAIVHLRLDQAAMAFLEGP